MNILVVEDDELMAEALQRALQPLCENVFWADTIEHAHQEMARMPPPDIIFLDLIVPPFLSSQTLEQIVELRKPNPRALVIVLTGSMEEKIEQASIAAGADAFLHKNDLTKQSALLKTMKEAIQIRMDTGKPLFEASADLFEKIAARLSAKA